MPPCIQKNNKFINPHVADVRKSVWHFVKWTLGGYPEAYSIKPMPKDFQFPYTPPQAEEQKPTAVWINHSTFLIEVGRVRFLTDPIWAKRCSPANFLGPKRLHEASIKIEDLPQIHFVLISHNHYDHLDANSVKKLHQRFPDITWIVPLGVEKMLRKLGITKTVSLSWWQEAHFEGGSLPSPVRITSVPSQHFSGRALYDRDKTLWMGIVVEVHDQAQGWKRFYFVGDTGYNPHDFKNIGQRFGYMDLSLIPIGTYVPRSFMSPVHIEPKQSVWIHSEVGSKMSLGMHWKTFKLSEEGLQRPPFDLLHELDRQGISPQEFFPVEPGYKVNW